MMKTQDTAVREPEDTSQMTSMGHTDQYQDHKYSEEESFIKYSIIYPSEKRRYFLALGICFFM